jgi:hypothetical protein
MESAVNDAVGIVQSLAIPGKLLETLIHIVWDLIHVALGEEDVI